MIRTGIFGGSFNPIHNGHLSLARQLRQKAELDEVWLMVSPQNPLKQQSELLDDRRRLSMAQLALEGMEGIVASDYELRLPKPSYTWNTLQALTADYPERQFVLLMGGDNWELFDRWYRHEDILANYHIVVYPRKSVQHYPEASGLSRLFGGSGNPEILESLAYIDISSTEIRRRIRERRSISRMVPKAVADYIRKEGLYA